MRGDTNLLTINWQSKDLGNKLAQLNRFSHIFEMPNENEMR